MTAFAAKSGLMKVKPYLSLGLFAVAMGCASHREQIHFSDESDVRTQAASAVAMPVQKRSLDRADEAKIEQTIFDYLLEGHFWDNGDYSAVFLQADDAQVRAMIKRHPNHVPPIKESYRALTDAHRAPLDKDTNKPAMILSVDVGDPNQDNSVDAIGHWYAGDAVTGFHAFHLQKNDGNWRIMDVK